MIKTILDNCTTPGSGVVFFETIAFILYLIFTTDSIKYKIITLFLLIYTTTCVISNIFSYFNINSFGVLITSFYNGLLWGMIVLSSKKDACAYFVALVVALIVCPFQLLI